MLACVCACSEPSQLPWCNSMQLPWWLPDQLQCGACSDITPCPGPAGHRNVVVSQSCNCFGVSPCLNSLAYRRIRMDLQHWWGPGQHFLWLQWATIFGDIIYWGFLVCVFFVAFLFFLVRFSLFGSLSVWVLLFACSLVFFFFHKKSAL